MILEELSVNLIIKRVSTRRNEKPLLLPLFPEYFILPCQCVIVVLIVHIYNELCFLNIKSLCNVVCASYVSLTYYPLL